MSAQDYDIQLDDKYGSLTLIDIPAEIAAHEPWFNQTLTSVNDAVVRLGILEGDFHWHKHDGQDEFFLVLDGELLIDLEDRDTVTLGRHRDTPCRAAPSIEPALRADGDPDGGGGRSRADRGLAGMPAGAAGEIGSGQRWRSTVAGLAAFAALAGPAAVDAAPAIAGRGPRLVIPPSAEQLIVVSSPTDDPPAPGYLATLRTYTRANARARPGDRCSAPGRPRPARGTCFPRRIRREGDHATPVGVFGIGRTMYGNEPNPGGLHYGYHRLRCGDWWDEDPYSPRYNQFVYVPCGITPGFAAWSEPLWRATVAYPYFAVIRFNMDPVRGGSDGLGSGIFLHNWVGGATEGCVAVREPELLRVLRWLRPSAHPVVEIGTTGQVHPR